MSMHMTQGASLAFQHHSTLQLKGLQLSSYKNSHILEEETEFIINFRAFTVVC